MRRAAAAAIALSLAACGRREEAIDPANLADADNMLIPADEPSAAGDNADTVDMAIGTGNDAAGDAVANRR